MVMYSTGATRRLRKPGCKGACISRFAPDTLETLYCGTIPGSQFQVCPYLCTIVAGLRRSRRLQYAEKSVNNPSTFAGECTPAPPPYLVNQVRSEVHCRICS